MARVRDELLNITEFGSLTEARAIIEDWRNEYNTWQPHSSSRAIWSLFKSAICEAVARAARCEAA